MAAQQLKLSSFYGDKIARPYVVLDAEGKPVQDRVDAPHVNDALLEWAARVPVKLGGTLVKPVYDGPEPRSLREARNDFQIFFTEQYDDVLAANPALFAADRKAMLAAASVYWRERLSTKERAEYRRRAVEEKAAAADAVAEAEAANPRFKAFREKLQSYKQSVRNILTAARVSSGPLWRAQRQLNAKYRLLDEQQAKEQEEDEHEQEGAKHAPLAGPSKAAGKARRAGGQAKGRGGRGGRKGAAQKRLVSSDSDSELEEEGEDEAAAVAAMEKLMLATSKKGAKASSHGDKIAGKRAVGGAKTSVKAATKDRRREEEKTGSSSSDDDDEEEEEEEESPGRRQRGAPRTRSGAAVLAQHVVAAAKGRRGYTGAFDLPPSQSTTPAKVRRAAQNAGVAKAVALPSKSPGKRARSSHAAAVSHEAQAEHSPAKKTRRSARK